MMKAVISLTLVAGAGVLVKSQTPEIRRYLQAKKM